MSFSYKYEEPVHFPGWECNAISAGEGVRGKLLNAVVELHLCFKSPSQYHRAGKNTSKWYQFSFTDESNAPTHLRSVGSGGTSESGFSRAVMYRMYILRSSDSWKYLEGKIRFIDVNLPEISLIQMQHPDTLSSVGGARTWMKIRILVVGFG